MKKVKRKIIKIDEEKCDGCGLCIPSCPEGALQIVDTPEGPKARLVRENFCDGLGACLGECPRGALNIIEEEVEEYAEEKVIAHIKEEHPEKLKQHLKHLEKHSEELPCQHSHASSKGEGCPGAATMSWRGKSEKHGKVKKQKSELRQWPVQLHLVNPSAPYFRDAELLIVADCVPFTYGNFHQDFLKGKAIAVGCPKLDDMSAYIDKLKNIFATASPKSITVVHMEVPCCFGLVGGVKQALEISGKDIPFKEITISIRGEVL